MKDLGAVDVILGLKIEHTRRGICIFQYHYIEKSLRDLTILIVNLLVLLLMLVADW